jgi:hypothetical protein
VFIGLVILILLSFLKLWMGITLRLALTLGSFQPANTMRNRCWCLHTRAEKTAGAIPLPAPVFLPLNWVTDFSQWVFIDTKWLILCYMHFGEISKKKKSGGEGGRLCEFQTNSRSNFIWSQRLWSGWDVFSELWGWTDLVSSSWFLTCSHVFLVITFNSSSSQFSCLLNVYYKALLPWVVRIKWASSKYFYWLSGRWMDLVQSMSCDSQLKWGTCPGALHC